MIVLSILLVTKKNDTIRPLCIILSQMSGYIKYFDNGGKNMSLKIEDENVFINIIKSGKKFKIC